ncbi:MAG TPA: Na+:solute symporter [Ignavibacteria bacterium]|nr:sodium:proline symporter [Bacteroidota bacterium]HRI85805.1 Na+:solute symporter [Ignavibacteria bacterium]HRJ98264.1 Na+:solute symporter [Ignavibacteria bacterium]
MHFSDWLIVIIYFVISFAVGIYYSKRSGGNTENFFLSGRKLTWWLAGLSMVATTFAADTPLAVTELVGQNGIAGNWLWWNMLIGGMLTVFFFARLWRRANILTDVEFIELRYSGKSAAFLRGFKAIYMGIFMNTIIMGWVNLAMIKILIGMFPEYVNTGNAIYFVGACMLFTAVYSAISGLWGVAVNDAFQFLLAMGGCIILAVLVVNSPEIGGIEGMKAKLPDWALRFTPEITAETAANDGTSAGGILALTISSFLAFIGLQWWASWYPGAEPGGGGYVAQRMMSAKDEKNSLFATLFFQVAHYCIRPWPWILVGLCSLILYPELSQADKGLGFVKAMNDFLPPGLKGLLLAAFFAAYMSTIATHLNWGTSYFINDFYRRFISENKSEKHYVTISRVMTIVFMFLSVIITTQMTSISGVWSFLIECGAGLGLVLIMRWFWWRVNAIAEIVATVTPFVVYGILFFGDFGVKFPETLFIIVPITTLAWIVTVYITKPTDPEKLGTFYERVHPGGIGWKQISGKMPEVKSDIGYFLLMINWLAGIIMAYSFLFGTGKIILGDLFSGMLFIVTGILAGLLIKRNFAKTGWN